MVVCFVGCTVSVNEVRPSCLSSDSPSSAPGPDAGGGGTGCAGKPLPTLECRDGGGRPTDEPRDAGPEQAGGFTCDSENAVDPTDRASLFLVAIFLVVLTTQYALKVVERPVPLTWQRAGTPSFFEVEINSATWIEWMQLKGIGPALAHRIVADRQHNGPFVSIDDLQRVDGIGPATLDDIRPWLTMRPATETANPSSGSP